ncbi:MAG: protein phosphatase 2C domain-containing protein [Gemmataceae bacterium]
MEPETNSPTLLAVDRYRIGERFEVRGNVERFHAVDADGSAVVIARQPLTAVDSGSNDSPPWPDLAWEVALRQRFGLFGLTCIVDTFADADFDYLVLERPAGVAFWDAWDDPAIGAFERFGWLIQLASLLKELHAVGAVLERLRPDDAVVTPLGQIVLDAQARLVPVPLPVGAPLQGGIESPPELSSGSVDARCDLYNFGALLYALELGRELTDLDFVAPGVPKPFLERFPDAHPMLGRLVQKTLQADPRKRFPSELPAKDPSGFDELLHVLGQAQRSLGRVRLDVSAWTSTGTTRPTNEDAVAVVHATEMRDGVQDEAAVVLLADGMGGSAAGEVAAALAIRSLRGSLLRQPPFAALAESHDLGPPPSDRESVVARIDAALREANRAIYLAALHNLDFVGMGCTGEAVYIDGRQLIVGHVGDSRTYRLHRGRLLQLTKDHTTVRQLVEMGQISIEEADTHPRRSELRQALGGRPDVEPDVSAHPLTPGDWILVCSDGLSSRLPARAIQDILEASPSAEAAARRLVNATNLAGSPDNVTVVVVRAT